MHSRLRPAVLLAVAAAIFACPTAFAATVGIEPNNNQLHYVAVDGEVNDLTVTNPSDTVWEWVEEGTVEITPGPQCELVGGNAHHARCTVAGDILVSAVLKDQDDIAKFTGTLGPSRQHGLFMFGDEGNDHLTGSPGDDFLVGDSTMSRGDDQLDGVGGDDTVDGGLGADEQLGGPGDDRTVYYGFERTGPVDVTLADDLPNDGNPNDDRSADVTSTDLDLTDVESVTGSNFGGDRLIGDGADNVLRVDGISAPSGSTIDGGPGNDHTIGSDHGDDLTGGPGNDSIQGWAGDDTLHAEGDPADFDALTCGDGTDGGDADAIDDVDASCENVIKSGGPDTTAPDLVITAPADQSVFPATQAQVRIAGTAGTASGDSAHVRVIVREGSATGTVKADTVVDAQTGGAWSYDFTPPGPGGYHVDASQSDAAGNATHKQVSFSLEAGASPPVTLTQPESGAWLRAAGPTSFAGTAGPGAVSLALEKLAAGTWQNVPTTPVTRDGTAWRAASEAELGDGTYRVQASQTGAASSPLTTFRVDRTDPRVAWQAPVDRGGTKDRTPLFRGTASADEGDGTTIDIDLRIWNGRDWVDVPGYPSRLTAQRTGTAWSLDLTKALEPGTYYARAYLSDAAGNRTAKGQGAPIIFRIDLSAPQVSIEQPAAGTRLRDLTPPVSGRASDNPGDAREVVVEYRRQIKNSDYGTPRTFRVARTGGTWSGTAPRLTKGVYAFRAMLSDDAGNTATSLWNVINAGRLAAPRYSGKHKIIGATEVREVLNVQATGRWAPDEAIEITNRWQRCPDTDRLEDCKFVTDPRIDTSYRVVGDDGGNHLRVRVSARNPDHEKWTREWSKFSGEIRRPDVEPSPGSPTPHVTAPRGDLSVGDKLTAHDGNWQGRPTPKLTRQWQRCSAITSWTACHDIKDASGRNETGPSLKLQPEDQWNKIRLLVKAENRLGWKIWATGQTNAIDANRASRRRANVITSYQRVFGREPKESEIESWLDADLTLDQLVAQHRQNLRSDRGLAEDVVTRAYEKVYGHGPYRKTTTLNANQTDQFNGDVNQVMAGGDVFDAVVERLATELTGQAYDMIFWWAGDVSRKQLVEKHVRERDVRQFVRKVQLDAYANKGNKTRGSALWSDVALSNEPLHGAALTSYSDGADGAADRELCVGGVGPSCTGVDGQSFSSIEEEFETLDGRRMAYVKLTTAIGSILHDADCRAHPNEWNPKAGAWCGNYPIGGVDLFAETPLWKWFAPSAAEWNKATANTLQNRKWFEYYGPYSLVEAQNSKKDKYADAWSDDLRLADKQLRVAKITHGGVIFGLGDFETPWKWEGRELRASQRLEATKGTTLDATDPGFCKSHGFAFKNPGTVIGQRPYNICS